MNRIIRYATHIKRLLIGGFPLIHPDQIGMDELGGYAYLTAGEITKHLKRAPNIFVDYSDQLMLHFPAPDRVMTDIPKDRQATFVVREAAERHRSQYVLVGRYHSFEIGNNKSSRRIDLEAFILDGFTGSCVARKRFSKIANGFIKLPTRIKFGSSEYYATDLGKKYGELLSDVAEWADATTSCQPFSARVTKVSENLVYFDAGAEQGISIGDKFYGFKTNKNPLTTQRGETLGFEKYPAGELRVTSVYPKFSISKIVEKKSIKFEIGDELSSK